MLTIGPLTLHVFPLIFLYRGLFPTLRVSFLRELRVSSLTSFNPLLIKSSNQLTTL